MSFSERFPKFDYDYKSLANQLPAGWSELPASGISCPRYEFLVNEDTTFESSYALYFDYKDPTLSEYPEYRANKEMLQFEIVDEFGEMVFNTDVWEEMLKFIKEDGIKKHYDNDQERRSQQGD